MSDESLKIISFNLGGDFAYFGLKETEGRVSLPIPTLSSLKGILGAIIGLKGYKLSNKNIDFIEKFKNVDVAIQLQTIPEYMEYSFNTHSPVDLVNTQKRSSQFKYQILYKQKYRIFLKINERNDEVNKLLYNLKNQQSVFPLYLGRNNYIASISDYQEHIFNPLDEKKTYNSNFFLKSIFPEKIISIKEENENFDFIEAYPFKVVYPFFGNKLFWSRWKKVVIPIVSIEQGDNEDFIFFKNDEIEKSEFNNFHIINDKDDKKELIYFFKGC